MYTPAKTLSASTVTSDKYTLKADTVDADVQSATYYPEQNQVKLTVVAALESEDTPFRLSSKGLCDTDGVAADETVTVYLAQEAEVEYNTVAVEVFTFVKDGVPVSDISGKDGISVNIRLANATGEPKCGVIKIYDGNDLCGEASYSVKNDGVTQLTVDTSAHIFSSVDNVTIKID